MQANDDQSPASRRRRRQLRALAISVALAVIGGLAGAVATYYLAPSQSVNEQRAQDADKEAADAGQLGAQAEQESRTGTSYVSGNYSYASPINYDLDHVRQSRGPNIALPGIERERVGIPVGPGDTPAQPRVYSQTKFTLVGNMSRPVGVKEITARIVGRLPPVSGTLFYVYGQGANPSESIGFDLDSANPRAELMADDASEPTETGRYYFDAKYVTLGKGERLQFTATVFTKTCHCDYVFDVEYSDGSVGTVDDGGRPWRVTPFSSVYQASYTLNLDIPDVPVVACRWPEECRSYG
jgi:hypothetical protein